MFRDVASIVVEKSYNTDTGRPYSISMLQNAMKDIHYSVSLSKGAKQQALDVIRRLKKVMPIARTKLSLRITAPVVHAVELEAMLLANTAEIVKNAASSTSTVPAISQDTSVDKMMDSDLSRESNTLIEVNIHPENFRVVEDLTTSITQGKGILEIIHQQQALGQSGAREDDEEEEEEEEEETRVHIVADAGNNKKGKGKPSTTGNSGKGKDDTAGSEDVVFFMAKSGKRNTKKKKEKKKLAKQQLQLDEDEEAALEDSDRDSDRDSDSNRGEDSVSAALSTLQLLEEAGGGRRKGGDSAPKAPKEAKKSKKNKRLEKEKKKEFDSSEMERSERLEALESERMAKKSLEGAEGATSSTPAQNTGGSFKCNTCSACFAESLDHRAHFKSDWHRINLKRKLLKLPLVQSEEEFYSVHIDHWDCNIDEHA